MDITTEKRINTRRINYFVIRETYRYMAKVDKITSAMSHFYSYLDIPEENYDKIVQSGYGDTKRMDKILISCGFSDTLFRRDSPTMLKMSGDLAEKLQQYLFWDSISLKEFRDYLAVNIATIMDTDNTLLVVCTRILISKMYSTSEPPETVRDFLNLMEHNDYSGHTLQKEFVPRLVKYYDWYKQNLPKHE
jgi:hypothetical protein